MATLLRGQFELKSIKIKMGKLLRGKYELKIMCEVGEAYLLKWLFWRLISETPSWKY